MDDLKEKLKGLSLKGLTKPFKKDPAASAFQGTGHKLGNASSSTTSSRPTTTTPLSSRPPSSAAASSRPSAPTPSSSSTTGDFDGFQAHFGRAGSRVPPNDWAQQQQQQDGGERHRDGEHQQGGLSEDVECAIALLRSTDGGVGTSSSGSVVTMVKLLSNVVDNPAVDKYRRLRLGNPAIAAAVVNTPGGMDLIRAVGFELLHEEEEGWATMPEEPTAEQIALMRAVMNTLQPATTSPLSSSESEAANAEVGRDAGIVLGGRSDANVNVGIPPASPQPKAPPAKLQDRQVAVFLPSSSEAASSMQLPDWFYDRSSMDVVADMKAAERKRENDKVLTTRAFKDKLSHAQSRAYRLALVRVRFPDGIVLQGAFLPAEPITHLFEWVSDMLAEPYRQFDLALARVPLPRDKGTLRDNKLVPAAVVNFRFTDDNTLSTMACCLRPDVAMLASPLSADVRINYPTALQ